MTNAPRIVFYSWQTDLPNATNRGFIEDALKKAAKAIQRDDADANLIIERDTKGVPGSPGIAKTIFGKIEQADVFVCDISIINREAVQQLGDRATPNPNVMIELGYALHALSEHRIILLLNEAYGERALLPFDLHTYRASGYTMHETDERAPERNRLAETLTEALRIILEHVDKTLPGEPIAPPSLAEQVRSAIEAGSPTQAALAQKYMSELAATIQGLTPAFDRNEPNRWDELLTQALEASTPAVIEFARLAEEISLHQATIAAQAMYKGFGRILDLYQSAPDFVGMLPGQAYDLAKFLGHELFVTFFSFLIRDDRWDMIADLLDKEVPVRNRNSGPRGFTPFKRISYPIVYRPGRPMMHCELLAERHRNGDLAERVPMEQFAEADYFLYLRTVLHKNPDAKYTQWTPLSFPYMKETPHFLQLAQFSEEAQHLLRPLKAGSIEDLRQLQPQAAQIFSWFSGSFTSSFWTLSHPMSDFDFQEIGSR